MKRLSDEQIARKKKMLLVMPVIVVPFVTLVFWALGGGTGGAATPAGARSAEAGINTELPGAKINDDETRDKMGFYELAAQDSAKRKEAIQNDPYYPKGNIADTVGTLSLLEHNENERQVYQKLNELNSELLKNTAERPVNDGGSSLLTKDYLNPAGDVDRLEQLLAASRQKDSAIDPETHALNNMLERILDIQHPERVKEKLQKASEENKTVAFAVYTENADDIRALEGGFISDTTGALATVIPAEIAETRLLYDGGTVKMRLLSDVFIMGSLIPRNTFVTGVVSFDDARMQVSVSGIYFQHTIFPVHLSVFDLRGIKGLELHANIQHELARQSGDRSLQMMNFSSPDPSIGAQAATAGIEAAKNIMSKRIKQIRVPVKAGEQVLLMSEQGFR